jgi:hypothetical protein
MTFAATGKQQFHVAGIYENNAILSDYLISIAAYDANVEQPMDFNVFLKVADGVSIDDAKTKLDALLQKDYPNVQALDQQQSKQQFLDQGEHASGLRVRAPPALDPDLGFGILATLWLSVFEAGPRARVAACGGDGSQAGQADGAGRGGDRGDPRRGPRPGDRDRLRVGAAALAVGSRNHRAG